MDLKIKSYPNLLIKILGYIIVTNCVLFASCAILNWSIFDSAD